MKRRSFPALLMWAAVWFLFCAVVLLPGALALAQMAASAPGWEK